METLRIDPERQAIIDNFINWKSRNLGDATDPVSARRRFIDIRDGWGKPAGPALVMSEELLQLLRDQGTVGAMLPAGTVVQDLALNDPYCFRIVLHDVWVDLYKDPSYSHQASVSPFVSVGGKYDQESEPPFLYVPFRVN